MKRPVNKGKPIAKKVSSRDSQSPSLTERGGLWCSSHRRLVILLIISLSLVFRLVYFIQLNNTHLINNHLWMESDMSFTDQWAKRIATADILTDTAMHPIHGWTKEIADQYFSDHPDVLSRYRKAIGTDTLTRSPAKMLWDRWYGGKQFHQEPLYAYFIGLNYKLFGEDVRWVFLWQMLAGVLTNLIVYLLARRHFGDFVAVIASSLVIFCGPLMVYELILLRTTFTVFLAILIPYLLGVAEARKKVGWWILTGAACGVGIALNAYFAGYLFIGLIILGFRFRKNIPGLAIAISGLLLGTALLLSPVFLRNSKVGVPVLSMNSTGAISFINENNDSFESFNGWMINTRYSSRIMSVSEGSLMKSIIPTLSTHSNVWSYLRQFWGKLHALFSWYEIQNNANFYFYRSCAPVLSILFVSFLILSPLALIGLIIALLKKKDAWPLYLAIMVNIIPLLVFMVLARYRISLVPLLSPFAALTIAELLHRWKGYKNLVIVVCLVPLFIWAAFPRNDYTRELWNQDFSVIYRVHYLDSITKAVNNGKLDLAILRISDFLDRYEPETMKNLLPGYLCRNQEESDLFLYFADIHQIRSRIYNAAGNGYAASSDSSKATLLTNAASHQ